MVARCGKYSGLGGDRARGVEGRGLWEGTGCGVWKGRERERQRERAKQRERERERCAPIHRAGGARFSTSLMRKHHPVGPYSRTMPRVLGGSQGGGRFLMVEVPLYSGPGPDKEVSSLEVVCLHP